MSGAILNQLPWNSCSCCLCSGPLLWSAPLQLAAFFVPVYLGPVSAVSVPSGSCLAPVPQTSHLWLSFPPDRLASLGRTPPRSLGEWLGYFQPRCLSSALVYVFLLRNDTWTSPFHPPANLLLLLDSWLWVEPLLFTQLAKLKTVGVILYSLFLPCSHLLTPHQLPSLVDLASHITALSLFSLFQVWQRV